MCRRRVRTCAAARSEKAVAPGVSVKLPGSQPPKLPTASEHPPCAGDPPHRGLGSTFAPTHPVLTENMHAAQQHKPLGVAKR